MTDPYDPSDATDPIDEAPSPDSFADLPMQPTGSGVADLEIAFEQMKLAEGADADAPLTNSSDGATESEAHPS